MTELQVVFVTLIIFLVFTHAIISCNYLLHMFLIMCTISQSLASQLAQFFGINTILMYKIIYANTIRNFSSFLLCCSLFSSFSNSIRFFYILIIESHLKMKLIFILCYQIEPLSDILDSMTNFIMEGNWVRRRKESTYLSAGASLCFHYLPAQIFTLEFIQQIHGIMKDIFEVVQPNSQASVVHLFLLGIQQHMMSLSF